MTEFTEEILNSPSVHYHVKETIIKMMHKDPVDSLHNAELIFEVMKRELADMEKNGVYDKGGQS